MATRNMFSGKNTEEQKKEKRYFCHRAYGFVVEEAPRSLTCKEKKSYFTRLYQHCCKQYN